LDDDQFQQFKWLEEQLVNATSNEMKVWMIQHEPPCNNRRKFTHKIIKLMSKFKDTIQYIFAGHEHRNIFQYLFDGHEYVNTVLMNSSIVPLVHESTFRV